MLMMISAVKKATNEEVDGYFDTCIEGSVIFDGFIRNLTDLGYVDIKIYQPMGKLSDVERNTFTDFQKEFAEAIGSTKYYPRTQYNDYMRIAYSKASPINPDFTSQEFKRGAIYNS